ncbi:hypothetical protein GCM10009702_12620 [Propioniferax innocua]
MWRMSSQPPQQGQGPPDGFEWLFGPQAPSSQGSSHGPGQNPSGPVESGSERPAPGLPNPDLPPRAHDSADTANQPAIFFPGDEPPAQPPPAGPLPSPGGPPPPPEDQEPSKSKGGKGLIIAGVLGLWALVIVLALALLLPRGGESADEPTDGVVTEPAAPSIEPSASVGADEPTEASPTSSSSGAPTPSPEPAVETLPSGSWILVLDSLDKRKYDLREANIEAEILSGSWHVEVLDSDAIAGLNGGYWALAVTGFSGRSDTTRACEDLGRSVGGSCYPRQVA